MISLLAVNRSDGIIRNPVFPTATPFVTRDIHLWRKLGVNISYPRPLSSLQLQVLCFIEQKSRQWGGYPGQRHR